MSKETSVLPESVQFSERRGWKPFWATVFMGNRVGLEYNEGRDFRRSEIIRGIPIIGFIVTLPKFCKEALSLNRMQHVANESGIDEPKRRKYQDAVDALLQAGDAEAATLLAENSPLDENNYPTSAAANEILQGVKFAVAEFNKDRDDKIGIIIRDTKNNEDEINEIRNELGSNSSVKAILGPIFSNEVRVTIKTFNDTNLPIISPTATDNDLTAVSENFFQANPPLAVRGKIMAQYVFFVENKINMAVLYSVDGYSPLIAASFIEEFEKLGGTIKVKETYKSNSFSLSEPISRIVAVDTLLEAPDTLQGIYIPLADKVDATAILSQMGQDSLYLPIFGNQDWFSARGFESAPGLSNMLTFSSDYFIDFNDNDYQEFSERFSKVYGKDPGRNVLYGYDITNYLLTVMRDIVPNRLAIKNKIISGMVSNGYHNNISFDENRVNRFLNIVRYRDGVFELIEKFRSGN
ncbi:MAG: ABC transporter substrate-binding protein [Bacteroidetes bacterium]|nr:ABC transporter substrate-binding protein [Bacteroidota bacterium]